MAWEEWNDWIELNGVEGGGGLVEARGGAGEFFVGWVGGVCVTWKKKKKMGRREEREKRV